MLGTPRMVTQRTLYKKVRGKIRELRIRDSEGVVRIFYFTFTGKRIVLSHGFIKKTARTPLREIEIVEKR
jgi:phage-related protein